MKLQLITLPIYLLNSLTGLIPKNEEPQKIEQTQTYKAANNNGLENSTYYTTKEIETWTLQKSTNTIVTDGFTAQLTYIKQINNINNQGSTPYTKSTESYYWLDVNITTYLGYRTTIGDFVRFYNDVNNEISAMGNVYYYFFDVPNMPKYDQINSIQQIDTTQATYTNIEEIDQQLMTNTTQRFAIQINNDIYTTNVPTINKINIEYSNETTPITIDTEMIDLPGLLWEILSMPFAFINQGFNLTLFPGTPYAINIANTIMVFLGVLILLAILKIVLKIFL